MAAPITTLRIFFMAAEPCEHVADFAQAMFAVAHRTRGIVLGRFNQHIFEARPGRTIDEIIRPWQESTHA